MIGVPYKDTFAAKGSQLYLAITEGRTADAKKIYAETSARYHATMHSLAVPVLVNLLDAQGKPNGKYIIESKDSVYDNNGRWKESK